MTQESLIAARIEAERFVRLAKQLEAEVETSDYDTIFGNRTSGSVRRASMDLTRALADMRRPG